MKSFKSMAIACGLLASCVPNTPPSAPSLSNYQLNPTRFTTLQVASGNLESLSTQDNDRLTIESDTNTQLTIDYRIPYEVDLEEIIDIQINSYQNENGQQLQILENGSWTNILELDAGDNNVRRFTLANHETSIENQTISIRLVAIQQDLNIDQLTLVINSSQRDTFDFDDSTPWWKPQLGQKWHMQYTESIELDDRFAIFNLDLFDTSAETIADLKSRGKRVICYFSAGSYENWRPDKDDFPSETLGKNMSGWPGEKWLDTSNREGLRPIMEARIKMAAQKGCDGVDPDNVDGYINNTGFDLQYEDTLLYNRMLADLAHENGLAIGLKNDVNQLEDLVDWYDFAVNEQCFQYNECDGYRVFTNAGKPVYQIEYNRSPDSFCDEANDIGMDSVQKNLKLDAWVDACFDR